MKYVDVVLDLDDRRRTQGRSARPAPRTASSRVSVHLSHKPIRLGELAFEQFWIPHPGLYGERNRESPNRQAIIDWFWRLCESEGSSQDDQAIQESYVLASLLPLARSNGSRRVFADAAQYRNDRRRQPQRKERLRELDGMLRVAQDEGIDSQEFHNRTADILGPPHYSEEVIACYDRLAAEILHDACAEFREGGIDGLKLATARWVAKTNTIGRRRGHVHEKQALDILSYECRAAFHRCYSATWFAILKKLAEEFDLSQESRLFHRLWHLDQGRDLPGRPDDRFHVFHGHIFGLHPACGDFLCTETGRRLTGDLLAAPGHDPCHQRFLHGLLIAVFDYARQHDDQRQLRRKQPSIVVDSLESVSTTRIACHGRRPHRGRSVAH